MRHFRLLPFALGLCLLCAAPANALSYNIDAPEDYLFGRPTSDDTIYEWENPNADRSKNTALIAPAFGSPTSYLPNSGEYLTPNLVPDALSGGLVNQMGAVSAPVVTGEYPPVNSGGNITMTQIPGVSPGGIAQGNAVSGYTEVRDDLYYDEGHLGTLKIPAIGVNTKVYQGTGDASLAKGAGHFEDTSIWGSNVCVAAHNRGVNTIFGKIHTLESGDRVTLTTKLGTKTYSVTSVEKISYTDRSLLASTSEDCITLFTCVRNESAYRWAVRAVAG